MQPDRFSFDASLGECLFTFALGLALGIILWGGWLATAGRSRAGRAMPASLIAAGLGLFIFVGLSAVDAGPVAWIDFRLKVYASRVTLVATLTAAIVAGIAAAFLVGAMIWRFGVAGARRDIGRAGFLVALTGATTVLLLAEVDHRERPRHPHGTVTSSRIGATRIAGGLDLPTGLGIGPGGEIFFTELDSGRLGIILPSSAGTPEPVTLMVIPRPEEGNVLHVALHPDWPSQPYLYVTAQYETRGEMAMRVLRVKTDGVTAGELQPVVEGLPSGLPAVTNHFGSALAFCGGYLFVSVGDTDTILGAARPRRELSALAQQPLRAEGKVLRYRLNGAELTPAGVIGQDPPVFAMGFRNPFGLGCDEDSGYAWVAENGNQGHDQVRYASPGSNHEWPFSEERERVTPPVFDSGKAHIAPTGVAVRTGPDGREVIVGAYQSAAVYQFSIDADGRKQGPLRLLFTPPAGVLALSTDHRGCVYFADSSAIWRLDTPGCER